MSLKSTGKAVQVFDAVMTGIAKTPDGAHRMTMGPVVQSLLNGVSDASIMNVAAKRGYNEYGEMMTENALRCTIAKYNKRRGVQKMSIVSVMRMFS